MRIGLYHLDLPAPDRKPGGVAVVVHRLANALVERGHQVTVRTYSAAPDDARYRVHRLRPRCGAHSTTLRQYLLPLARNLEQQRCHEVLHLHGDDWFFLSRRVPTVRTFHGTAMSEARTATTRRRRGDKRMIARLERLSASLADVTIAVGPDAHRAFDTDLLIPPGIDADHDRSGGRSPHPSILFVGTWSGRKRGALLAERFRAEVRPRFPDSELWMVADRCTAGDGVRWLGAPSDAELRGLYASAWAFCLPSTYEGFGIPYAEALAAGTPVVASDNPGAQFVLRGGRDGVIAADAELGTALSRLLGDAAERDRLGRAGRERAQAFRWPALVDRHEEAYAMAVERFARRRGRR